MASLEELLKGSQEGDGEDDGDVYGHGYDEAVDQLFDALKSGDKRAFAEAFSHAVELCSHQEPADDSEEGSDGPHHGLLILAKPDKG